MSTIKELIESIDQAAGSDNVESLKIFIEADPDLDLNAVTNESLSALWQALIPPKGKAINQALVRYLLPQVNVVQTYFEQTPRQYLQMLNELDPLKPYTALLKDLLTVENQHVNLRPAAHPARTLADIAADKQNVHDSEMVSETDQSVIRLYQRYGETLNTDSTLKEIRQQLLPPSISFLARISNNLISALDDVEKDPTKRIYQLENGQKIHLTLSDVLCLAWHAAHEKDASLLCGSGISASDVEYREKMIAQSLKDGKGYCWVGRYSRIVHALNAMHADVHYEDIELTNEQSRNKYVAMVGQELSDLAQKDIKRFWQVVRARLLEEDTDDDDKQGLSAYIKQLLEQNFISSLRDERLNEKIISDFEKELHEQLLPIVHYLPIKHLVYLENFYVMAGHDKQFYSALSNAKDSKPEELVEQLKNDFPITFMRQKISALEKELPSFLKEHYDSLSTDQQNGIHPGMISVFVQGKSPSVNWANELTRAMGAHYIASYHTPHEKWYRALSADLQVMLINEFDESGSDKLMDGQFTFQYAIKHKQLKHYNLSHITLQGFDLRGADLADIDLENVVLNDADCRLITFNEKTNFKNVDLSGANLSPNSLFAAIQAKNLSLINAILEHHDLAFLLHVRNEKGQTPLHHLLYQIQIELARTGRCDEKIIKMAEVFLSCPHLDLTLKDNQNATVLKMILGQNTLFREGDMANVSFYLPPIPALLKHTTVIQNAKASDRAVKIVSTERNANMYKLVIVAARVVASALVVALVVGLSVAVPPPPVGALLAAILVPSFLGALVEGVASFKGGNTRAALCAGYQYLSSYHNPFVLTNKNLLRIKEAGHALLSFFTYPVKYILKGANSQLPTDDQTNDVTEKQSLLKGTNTSEIRQGLGQRQSDDLVVEVVIENQHPQSTEIPPQSESGQHPVCLQHQSPPMLMRDISSGQYMSH